MDPSAGQPAPEDESVPQAEPPAAPHSSRDHFVATALAFELGLGVVASLIGWVLGHQPAGSLRTSLWPDPVAVLVGVVAAGPLFAALLAIQWRTPKFLDGFNQDFHRQIVPLFSRLNTLELGMLALAAGVGEELLFRGLVQEGLVRWIGGPWGLIGGVVLASLLFGACHWINRTYAVITTLVGVYLGILFLACDNLLAPIAAHAAYDFAALVYLTHDPDVTGTEPSGDGS